MIALGKYKYKESPTTDTVPHLSFIFDNSLGFEIGLTFIFQGKEKKALT